MDKSLRFSILFSVFLFINAEHFPAAHMANYCERINNNGFCDIECDHGYSEKKDCENDPIQEFTTVDVSVTLFMTEYVFAIYQGIFLGNIQMATRSRAELLTDVSNFDNYEYTEDPYETDENGNLPVFSVTLKVRLTMRKCDICTSEYIQERIQKYKEWDELNISVTAAVLSEHHSIRTQDEKEKRDSSIVALAFCLMSLVAVLGLVYGIITKSRKRRAVTAPVWFPPAELSDKDLVHIEEGLPAKRSCANGSGQSQESGGTIISRITVQRPTYTVIKHEEKSSERSELHWLAEGCGRANWQSVVASAQRILEKGVYINAQDEREETALMVAVRGGHYHLAKFLLDSGADGTIMNINYSTCLHHAVHNMDKNMLQLLLAYDKIVNSLVDGRRSIDAVDELDKTPLMLCAEYPPILAIPLAKILIKAGADPADSGDKTSLHYNGMTVLHYAAKMNNVEMIKYLVDLPKVNINAEDSQGCTPLWQATICGNYNAVEALLNAGANGNIPDELDHYPVDVARVKGFMDIAMLIEKSKRNRVTRKKRKTTVSSIKIKKRRSSDGHSSGYESCTTPCSPFSDDGQNYSDQKSVFNNSNEPYSYVKSTQHDHQTNITTLPNSVGVSTNMNMFSPQTYCSPYDYQIPSIDV